MNHDMIYLNKVFSVSKLFDKMVSKLSIRWLFKINSRDHSLLYVDLADLFFTLANYVGLQNLVFIMDLLNQLKRLQSSPQKTSKH